MLTILVVEDEAKARELLAEFFTMKGHSVREAQNGEEAVAASMDHCFDAAFMDVKMPKLDGVTASRQIHALCPDTEIVLMTGYVVDAGVDQALEEGTVACLKRKPFTLTEMTSVLEGIESNKTHEDPPRGRLPFDETCC